MNSPLTKLVGMRLAASDEAEGSVGLFFDGCTLRGFTSFWSSAPLEKLFGAAVTSVCVDPEMQLQLMFGRAGEIAISLDPADYIGPEAFVAHFTDGVIVVK